ncbi:MAG: endonuclease/exonuclease/phosphatase family protein, partial [Verrucomicrobia bacterium]|nr:endonuclease/exonuclease/phosphatase family protein [Verrucomicrobiota bacterium]
GPEKSTCRMLLANVKSENTGYKRLLELVRSEKPDVIILEEVNQGWIDAVSELRVAYPYHIEYPEEDNFGIAFYTKLPVQSMKIETIGEIQLASVCAVIEHGGAVWNIVGTHPLPPGGGAYWHWRNEQLNELASYVRRLDGHVVVLGDLNLTPRSYYFRKFTHEAQLRDGGKGFGLQISWPTFFPPLGIPIDHCLVSAGINVRDRRTGHGIGSDHYPVVVDLYLAEPQDATDRKVEGGSSGGL